MPLQHHLPKFFVKSSGSFHISSMKVMSAEVEKHIYDHKYQQILQDDLQFLVNSSFEDIQLLIIIYHYFPNNILNEHENMVLQFQYTQIGSTINTEPSQKQQTMSTNHLKSSTRIIYAIRRGGPRKLEEEGRNA